MTEPFSEEQIAAIERIIQRALAARSVDDEAQTLFLIDAHTRGLVEHIAEDIGRLTTTVEQLADRQQKTETTLQQLATTVEQLADRQQKTETTLQQLATTVEQLADRQQKTEAALQQLAVSTANGFDFVNARIDTVESHVAAVHEGIEALSNQNAQILRRLDER